MVEAGRIPGRRRREAHGIRVKALASVAPRGRNRRRDLPCFARSAVFSRRRAAVPPEPQASFRLALAGDGCGVTGRHGYPAGIHRTFLLRDGSGKAPATPARMMLGRRAGGAVRLAEPAETLAVGEGIESTLSAMQATALRRGRRFRRRASRRSRCPTRFAKLSSSLTATLRARARLGSLRAGGTGRAGVFGLLALRAGAISTTCW